MYFKTWITFGTSWELMDSCFSLDRIGHHKQLSPPPFDLVPERVPCGAIYSEARPWR